MRNAQVHAAMLVKGMGAARLKGERWRKLVTIFGAGVWGGMCRGAGQEQRVLNRCFTFDFFGRGGG